MTDEPELKPWIPARGISPLASQEERASYLEERQAELQWILKGPSLADDWYRAQEELLKMRFGPEQSDDLEWSR